MKRFLLLLMTLVLAVSGIKAAPSISKNGSTITLSGFNAGDLAKVFAGEIEGISAEDFSGVSSIVFGSGCALNADDFTAMSSTTHPELSGVKTVDMSNATVSVDTSEGSTATAISTMSGMNLSGMEYLRLPDSMTSADDVTKMKDLHSSSKNQSLKMAGAFDNSDDTWIKVSLTSFKTDEVTNFLNAFNLPVGWHEQKIKEVRMAGLYGVTDLVNNGAPNFGKAGVAVWDFTGANFANCEVNVTLPSGNENDPTAGYYAYNDPFCENGKVTYTSPYQTNAFYYFSAVDEYKKHIVELKLPDVGMNSLPYQSLYNMGTQNKADYLRYKNITELGDLAAVDASGNKLDYGVIEDLIIPDCYTDIDTECGKQLNVRHLVIGSGMKRIHGGAFGNSPNLTDLDFGAGLSECYVGDHAFYECNSMKHIALSEGIVSVGSQAFYNSQHLESIRLPETLINIGDEAFFLCLALNSITIPQNVNQIGRKAFWNCPLTDIFLTNTDPEKIPIMWSAGTQENYSNISSGCSFYNSAMYGWGTIQGLNINANNYHHLEDMSWEEATAWYFINENGLPVLHYPKELARKVHAEISQTYHTHTKADESGVQYGLPLAEDLDSRGRIPGADLGDSNGKWTRDGWAQFLLMKEFTTDPGEDVYQKEYKDVWYTMCFPFDLTDEQLAAAFNETFNIVDFSGIQIEDVASKEDASVTVKQMILHFDRVAVTDYKDTEGKHYKRVMEGGKPKREKDENNRFEYNVYSDEQGNQYHHVITINTGDLQKAKTKTFVRGNSIENSTQNFKNGTYEAVLIDGILATAGHPYMIHPAIGVKAGSPAKRCTFAGISWLGQSKWAKAFEDNSRTIDLGIKKTIEELPDSNYNHKGYAEYANKKQKYTFIGNPKIYRDDAQAAVGDEPQIPEKPTEPIAPPKPTDTLSEPTVTLTEPSALTADEQELVSLLTDGKDQYNRGPWYGISEKITANYNDGSDQANSFNNKLNITSNKLQQLGYDVYNGGAEAAFNYCKTTFNKSINYASDYAAYLANKALWDAYRANQAAWTAYNSYNPATAQSEYQAALDNYNDAVAAHSQWEKTASTYKVLIPQYAYFLGTKAGENYPKFFREMREDQKPRDKGVWNQFTAVIIPNKAALKGLEAELDGKEPAVSGAKIAYNEDYFVFDDTPQGIATLIEKIEKEEGKAPEVEYMDIVVSIDGKIVSRDKTTFEGLPKGVYIINGKKYYVK
jgi:hypothetical protein